MTEDEGLWWAVYAIEWQPKKVFKPGFWYLTEWFYEDFDELLEEVAEAYDAGDAQVLFVEQSDGEIYDEDHILRQLGRAA